MRTYDFGPLSRSSVGFDRWFDLINNAQDLEGQESRFPPYDIVRTGEESYRVALAVAGFSPADIAITAQQNLLIVAGTRPNDGGHHEYLHQGITAQSFERRFSLADHVEVDSASYENGLLLIDLVRKIPEAMKPRRIQIGGAAPKSQNGKSA
jgi:molecular chaperone IbpA